MEQSWPQTPAEALAELLAGNQRFVSGTRVHPNQDADHRSMLVAAQRPFAVVFGCSDSRLAAEIIFDRGLGDLFVVRTAGHITGPEILASISYAVMILFTPLVIVLGHDSCGAIQAACSVAAGDAVDPHLAAIVDRIAPTMREARVRGVDDPDDIARLHVKGTVDLLLHQAPAVAMAVDEKRCAVVGMSYRLTDGRITTITDAPAP